MIDLDKTLLIQLANFLVTLVALNFLLIKPVRQQIADRNALTADCLADIEKCNAEAAAKVSAYENAVSEARSKASLARDALKAEGQTQEQATIHAAQAEAQRYLNSAKKQIAEDTHKATAALLSQVNAYAAKALDKILG
ncbi:MAG: ATP synthase F0 subunit B [Desulfovibrio sp.]|jgi:F-type H+-transporting ATPase subunit b|nr:ATP synthase F0 subunit B [Desulfovibrio sp.]